jgi:uncharacterized protein (DUF1800 family)
MVLPLSGRPVRRRLARLVFPGALVFFLNTGPLLAAEASDTQETLELDKSDKLGPITVEPEPEPEPTPGFFRQTQFQRGDANGDDEVDLSDSVQILAHVFNGGNMDCKDAADVNDDGALDLSDAVYGLGYVFTGTAPPPPPGPDECGFDPGTSHLGCEFYPACADDFALIAHVLDRITFGPTEALYTQIQTKADLLDYMAQQLDGVPANYEPVLHEPAIQTSIDALDIGFGSGGGGLQIQFEKLKSSLMVYAVQSEWQLLHVITQFFNNHFHTQIDAVQMNFFQRAPVGGPAVRGTPARFALIDINPTDTFIDEAEWTAFMALHSASVLPWTSSVFARHINAGDDTPFVIDLSEFIALPLAYWKYGTSNDQGGVSADMEKREYDLYRRFAFGRFEDMVDACAKSVAMVIYLNSFENTVQAPNENFGREILELFVKGVDDCYTQKDIEEISKVFTGFTLNWVARAPYPAGDINFHTLPGSPVFPINVTEPNPFPFPTQQFWDDGIYTWGHVLRPDQHDWGTKGLFLQIYGGTDSHGNPLPSSAELVLPPVFSVPGQTVGAVEVEFDLVLDKLMSFRDTAKFISTKLIRLLVTDDLSLLPKTGGLSGDLLAAFQSVDLSSDGNIDLAEWLTSPTPNLPNGRPADKFQRLDTNGDGLITQLEYQEPDLLVACIDAWQLHDGEIREVLRTILFSDEFLSLKFYRAKIKDPFEVTAGAMRLLNGVVVPGWEFLYLLAVRDIQSAGMDLFNFSDPTGESELGFDWMHTIGLLERLKFLNNSANPEDVSQNFFNTDLRFIWDPNDFPSRWELDTAERAVDFLVLLAHNGDVLNEHRALAVEFYEQTVVDPGDPLADFRKFMATVAYVLSLPQYQKE